MNALEIKENRKKLGLTQQELADKLGVSLKTVSNYEKGEVIPDSKKALLRNILNPKSNNTLQEPEPNYFVLEQLDEFDEQISQVEEKIKERNKIIELENKSKKPKNIKHHEEIIDLLKKQIEIIKIAKKDYYLDK